MKTSPAEIQKHLAGVDYPASKQSLIETAERESASTEVIDDLQSLPEREYDGPPDVMTEFEGSSTEESATDTDDDPEEDEDVE